MKPEYLAWDSSFFNCNVGRLIIEPDEEISMESLDDFDLVYLIVKNELPPLKKKDIESKAFFADEKLTYQKKVTTPIKLGKNIFSWPKDKDPEENLLKIGVASGEFSRFKTDPEIKNEK